MFKGVQTNTQETKTRPENAVFNSGITLGKRNNVNQKFTYRELTVILGIVVALLVVFMLWFTSDDLLRGSSSVTHLPQLPQKGATALELLRKASSIVKL